MNHVHTALFRESHNSPDVEVGAHRPFSLPDHIRLVRLEPVNRKPVFLRVDGHGPHPEFGRGTEHPDGNLAADCHE